jgi:peptide/nickel transport system substrate-binding protein
MMNKKRYVLVFCLLAASMLLAACGPTATPEPTAVPEVGEAPSTPEPSAPTEPPEAVVDEEPKLMRVGIIGGPDCFNPWSCTILYDFVDLVHEGLIEYGPDCELVPNLAKSMEVSEDGLTWTLHLQEGVTYSDGEPFNAYTLKEFWDWDNSLSIAAFYLDTLLTESTEALDENTFQFTTSEPTGILAVSSGIWLNPLPPHIWGQMDENTVYTFDNYPPVGTGPYTLTDWAPGEYLIYDVRDDYWAGRPFFDRVVIQVYGNWDTLIQALIAGEIDAVQAAVPVQFYDVLVTDPTITTVEESPGNFYYVAFNMAEGGSRHPAVEDPVVREAIDHAINRQELIDVALFGHGIECITDFACGPRFDIPRNPEVTVAAYDPDKAKSILEETGYLDTDGDSIRETPDGEPLELRLFYDVADPTMDVIARLISDSLMQVGIAVAVEGLEVGTMRQTMLDMRDFDMGLHKWIGDSDPVAMDWYYSCWSAEMGSGGLNDSGYCDPEFDDLLWMIMSSIGWENTEPYYFEASRMLNNEVRPVITLAGENYILAYRNDRLDYEHDQFCSMVSGLWDWYSLMHVKAVE